MPSISIDLGAIEVTPWAARVMLPPLPPVKTAVKPKRRKVTLGDPRDYTVSLYGGSDQTRRDFIAYVCADDGPKLSC